MPPLKVTHLFSIPRVPLYCVTPCLVFLKLLVRSPYFNSPSSPASRLVRPSYITSPTPTLRRRVAVAEPHIGPNPNYKVRAEFDHTRTSTHTPPSTDIRLPAVWLVTEARTSPYSSMPSLSTLTRPPIQFILPTSIAIGVGNLSSGCRAYKH